MPIIRISHESYSDTVQALSALSAGLFGSGSREHQLTGSSLSIFAQSAIDRSVPIFLILIGILLLIVFSSTKSRPLETTSKANEAGVLEDWYLTQ